MTKAQGGYNIHRNCQVKILDTSAPCVYNAQGDEKMSEYNKSEIDSLLTRDLLFDFYGDLLTEHQKRIFEAVMFVDRSISEVAREEGRSRQSVSDLLKRVDQQLQSYEEKLKLVRKFREQRERIRRIRDISEGILESRDPEGAEEIRKLTEELLEET